MMYFWKKGKVITFHTEGKKKFVNAIYSSKLGACYCVDTSYGVDVPQMRYGKFIHKKWRHVPSYVLPKKFQMSLLLMGIALSSNAPWL